MAMIITSLPFTCLHLPWSENSYLLHGPDEQKKRDLWKAARLGTGSVLDCQTLKTDNFWVCQTLRGLM